MAVKTSRFLAFFLVLNTLFFTQTIQANNQKVDLRIHGSNTIGEKFAPELLKQYFLENGMPLFELEQGKVAVERLLHAKSVGGQKQVSVELHSHGSSTGFEKLANNAADIALSSRPIKQKEIDSLAAKYPSILDGSAEHVIAYDGLAIIVHPDNPITTLTIDQLALIFSGELSSWSELGGSNEAIEVLARDKSSGTFDTFKSLVLKPNKVDISDNAGRFESSSELRQHVLANPSAIGFIGVSYVGDAKLLAIAKQVGDQGIKPNKYTIGTEDYPLSRKLFLYKPTEIVSEIADDFVRYVESSQGQQIAETVDLISYYPTLQSVRKKPASKLVNNRYKNLFEVGKRLSVVFRLEDSLQDNKSKRDIERLQSFIKQNPKRRVVLVGFRAQEDESNSSKQTVERDLAEVSGLLKSQQAKFWLVDGGYLPIEVNDSEYSQTLNRRVEVWIL